MKISERFAEYGLTGAFFWLTQPFLLALWLTDISMDGWVSLMGQLNYLLSPVPSSLQSSIAGLSAALAVIGIFVTGLLIDLFGSIPVFREMGVFRKYLGYNHIWLSSIVKEYGGRTAKDFRVLHYRIGATHRMINPGRPAHLDTKGAVKRLRKLPRNFKLAFVEFKYLGTFHRFQSFVLAFVLINSGASRLDTLFDNVYLWRVSRAISTTIVILALELVAICAAKYYTLSKNTLITYFVAYTILIVASVAVTVRAYSRLCATLFSLAHVTHNRLLSEKHSTESK